VISDILFECRRITWHEEYKEDLMPVKMKLVLTDLVPTYDWAIDFYITFPY